MGDEYIMFSNYPDVVNVKAMRQMLGGISRNTAYKLLSEKAITAKKMGRIYLIPKANVIKFLENK